MIDLCEATSIYRKWRLTQTIEKRKLYTLKFEGREWKPHEEWWMRSSWCGLYHMFVKKNYVRITQSIKN